MNLLQKQSYLTWFDFLANKIVEWNELKPDNKDLKNCIKAIGEIGIFTNSLLNENTIVQKRLDLLRHEKNNLIIKQKKEIEDLKQKLKQYEI